MANNVFPIPLPVSGPLTDSELRATPVPVDISGGTVSVDNINALAVIEAIRSSNYDLQSAAYSQSTNITADYLLGRIELHFTTTESRDITISTETGAVLWSAAADTSLDIEIDGESKPFNADDNITIAITQTAGACVVDVLVAVEQGTATLGSNPVLGASNEHIGNVGIEVSDSAAADAFGRLRVSYPQTTFEAVHQYNESPLFWGTIVAGGGAIAHLPNQSAVELQCGTASGDSVKFQTKRYMRYQAGKSSANPVTFVMGAAKANVRRRAGRYDDSDGILIEQNGTTDVAIIRRTSTSGSPVDNRVVQADWNIDPFDGTGPSGLTLDLSKSNLLFIDLQWLSVGRVRIGFDINGTLFYAHQFLNANVLTVPYMKTANLPIRYEMTNTGTAASASTMTAICCADIVEGGHDRLGIIRGANSGTTAESVGTTREIVLAVRPKLTFNSIANRGTVQPIAADILASGDILWEIVHLPVLTGASWVSAGANSIVEYDISTTSFTGGEVVASGYKGTGSSSIDTKLDLERLILSLDPAGTSSDVLAIAITSLGGNVNTYAAMNWREEY